MISDCQLDGANLHLALLASQHSDEQRSLSPPDSFLLAPVLLSTGMVLFGPSRFGLGRLEPARLRYPCVHPPGHRTLTMRTPPLQAPPHQHRGAL